MNEDLAARAAHRADLQAKAAAEMAAIGIDAAFLDRMVETFYSRVRAHATLGPVFEARLAGRWPEHLARLKLFWQAVALRNGAYSGRPVPAHRQRRGGRVRQATLWPTSGDPEWERVLLGHLGLVPCVSLLSLQVIILLTRSERKACRDDDCPWPAAPRSPVQREAAV